MKLCLKPLVILLLFMLAETAFCYGRFLYFTDEEVNPADDPGGEITISFYGADNIYGRLHSNGWIKINGAAGGYPQFYGPVSTAREDVMWLNGTNPDYDIFHEGIQFNYPDSSGYPLPPEAAIDSMRTNAGLAIWSTDVFIDSLDSWEEIATTLRIRGNHLLIEQWLYDHFYPDGDTIFHDGSYQYGQTLALPPPQQGVVALQGKLFLEGYLSGQVTFLSADTIWLIDDVWYADVAFDGVNWIGNPPEDEKGMPVPGSSNRMGIVSEKNVIIAFTPQNGGYNSGQNLPDCDAVQGVADREHILITAAIMALDNVFEADFWHNSCTNGGDNPYGLPAGHPCHTNMTDLRGNIYLWGAVVQQRRGFVRRSPIGPYGNRFIGYDKRYHYDENFAISFPPLFPILMTDTLEVPVEFTTIQAAIDSSISGDVILVDPGVYQENLVIDGKGIILTSRYQLNESPGFIEETVIDGGGAGAVILIRDCEYMYNRISGFTLTNGSGFFPDTSDNTFGGGICWLNSDPILEDLIITGNTATYGGGIYCDHTETRPPISRITATGNTAPYGGGFCYMGGCFIELQNSIFWDNAPDEMYPEQAYIDAVCCDIQGGWWMPGNIDTDPLFCNPESGHYRLLPESPCRTDNCGVMGFSDAQCDPERVTEPVSQPVVFYLRQNHPNPFNPSTTIEYGLDLPCVVELAVYNQKGQLVDVIQSGFQQAGYYSVEWEPGDLASGIYLYRLTAGGNVVSRKMVLIK